MTVSKRTRYEVLKRDNHTCRYCHATDSPLTVDHVTPVALGGTDSPGNLVTACRDCNAGKASTSPDGALVEDIANDALRWAAAQKLAAKVRLDDRKARDAFTRKFDKAWRAQDFDDQSPSHPRPRGWQASIWDFYAAGLPVEEVQDAVIVATSNMKVALDSVWRYFCGVCYRKLDDINQSAQAILEYQEAPDGS